ncbi:MAG: hypothetical protein IT382_25645 [Deltaproteobacteria bacterium]|nr:hypothetical protein [Deltaproteobacteria bacterium]
MADKKKDAKPIAQLDKRVIDRSVARGFMSRTEYDAHLKALPDLADQADNIADKIYGERK